MLEVGLRHLPAQPPCVKAIHFSTLMLWHRMCGMMSQQAGF